MTTDFKRLGRRGSYRLGQLRAQGVKVTAPPEPFRMTFARKRRRGPASLWLLGLLTGVVVIALGARLGWWFVPFVVGVTAGLANRIGGWGARVAVPALVVVAVAGWGLPLLWRDAHSGQPYGAVAREVAAIGGLPAYAAVGIAVTLVVAIVQAGVGYWLGRALTPRPRDE
jgi:hypothetical protein